VKNDNHNSAKSANPCRRAEQQRFAQATLDALTARIGATCESGERLRSIGKVQDITERKQVENELLERKRTEDALRRSNEILTKIFSTTFGYIGLLSPDARVLEINNAALALRQLRREDVVGKPFVECFWGSHGAEGPERIRDMLRRAAEGETVREEFPVPTADGAIVIADSVLSPLFDATGKVAQIFIYGVDITERRRAEEALLQSEKERAEAEKLAATGRLAARIAHEINNPLAGIANAFRLFRDAVPKDCPEYRYVERTEKEIQRLKGIIRLMYDLHRPNQERETEVQIDETVRGVVMMLEPLCRQHATRVEIESPVPVIRASVPEGSLRQILFALVTNAIEVSLASGTVRIGLAADCKQVVLSISDEGGGIPDKLRDRIFEPFFSTKIGKGNEGGLGLGLSTAKQLAESLGGRLDYESKVGKGTVFRVRLPMARIKGVVL
jgi:PAS domain S-box-containing protein